MKRASRQLVLRGWYDMTLRALCVLLKVCGTMMLVQVQICSQPFYLGSMCSVNSGIVNVPSKVLVQMTLVSVVCRDGEHVLAVVYVLAVL